MSVPKSNFEGHLLLKGLAAVWFWHVRKLKVVVLHPFIYFEKNIKLVKFRILVEK